MEADEDTIKLRDVTAIWNGPDKLYIEIPESYSESDIQIYLDDTLLSQMPANDDDIFLQYTCCPDSEFGCFCR